MGPAITVGGVSIPKLGIGTYPLEGEACARTVADGLALGYRHVDTAEAYHNEAAVGEGIRASGVPREEIFVTSKVWYDHLTDGLLQVAAEASLDRLGLDVIDLYLIHWPNPEVPVSAAIAALNTVHQRGLVRAIGISNFPSAMMEEAIAASDVPLAVNQVEYHPYLDQSRLLEIADRHDMAITAFCPLARGKILKERAVVDIAAAHGVTPAAVTLAWLIGQPRVIAIPKSSNRKRLEENLAGQTVLLSDEERRTIDALATPDGRMVNPSFAPRWDSAAA